MAAPFDGPVCYSCSNFSMGIVGSVDACIRSCLNQPGLPTILRLFWQPSLISGSCTWLVLYKPLCPSAGQIYVICWQLQPTLAKVEDQHADIILHIQGPCTTRGMLIPFSTFKAPALLGVCLLILFSTSWAPPLLGVCLLIPFSTSKALPLLGLYLLIQLATFKPPTSRIIFADTILHFQDPFTPKAMSIDIILHF